MTTRPTPAPMSEALWAGHRRAGDAGFFTAGAPGSQPCPACAGGRLQPVAIWDLRTEAAPPGMLRLVSDAAVQRLETGI